MQGFLTKARVSDLDTVGSGVFLVGSGFQISLGPDPIFNFFWIRIRFQPRFWNKKNCRKVSKSDLSEENLKFMTKDRQKMKKTTISY